MTKENFDKVEDKNILFDEILGKNILTELNNRNWTQASFSKKLGVSKQVLQKIIKGKKSITALEIVKICKILDIRFEKLINTEIIENDIFIQLFGSFTDESNFNFLNNMIDEYINMEEKLNE